MMTPSIPDSMENFVEWSTYLSRSRIGFRKLNWWIPGLMVHNFKISSTIFTFHWRECHNSLESKKRVEIIKIFFEHHLLQNSWDLPVFQRRYLSKLFVCAAKIKSSKRLDGYPRIIQSNIYNTNWKPSEIIHSLFLIIREPKTTISHHVSSETRLR